MELVSADLGSIIFFFPGVVFTGILIFVWLFISNYLLQKIDKNEEINFADIVKNFISTFNKQNVSQKFSSGFVYLLIEIVLLFIVQIILLLGFFSDQVLNGFFVVLLLIFGVVFEIIYQLELGSNVFIFVGKIFSEIFVLICLIFLLISNNTSSFSTVSQHIVGNFDFFTTLFFFIIIFSIGKLSTYMDYKKTPLFQLVPNDQNLYYSKIENGNVSEKYIRWINETYSQIVFSQLVVFLLFPTLGSLLGLLSPIWIQFFFLFIFQILVLFLTLFFGLFNPIIEFKKPNSVSKVLVVVLFIVAILIFQ